ncbi:MAG: N-acetylmuramoyl-L-alanine amidase [Bacteroidota bacterium]
MLKKFFELLSSFFSSLFGGKKSEPVSQPKTRPAAPGDLMEDSFDVPADTIITVPVADADKFIPLGGGPFGDDDKEGAFEEPTEPTKPATTGTTQPTLPPKPEPSTPPIPTTVPTTPVETGHKPRFLWCLNNGHGKLQEGKRSPLFEDGKTRFFEYEFNRDIVERIIKELDKKGVKYFDVVPDYNEVGQFLPERVKRANDKKSDLPRIYVAVHANATAPAPGSEWAPNSVKGIETWFAANSKKGVKLAAIFQKHIVEKTGMRNRGLKSTAEKGLYELEKTDMPAVLTENGFFNNKEEAKELMKDEVRQKIADAHVAAIMEIEENGIV